MCFTRIADKSPFDDVGDVWDVCFCEIHNCMLVSSKPRPLGTVRGFVIQYNLQQTKAEAPASWDSHGVVIRLEEYKTKLATGDIVMVECQLQL